MINSLVAGIVLWADHARIEIQNNSPNSLVCYIISVFFLSILISFFFPFLHFFILFYLWSYLTDEYLTMYNVCKWIKTVCKKARRFTGCSKSRISIDNLVNFIFTKWIMFLCVTICVCFLPIVGQILEQPVVLFYV